MRLKVGVIGVGIQGQQHILAYKSHPLVELIAAADVDEAKLKRVCGEYNIPKGYTDYRDMIDKEELDLVSVVTPDFLHYEPVTYALKGDVNVIVEKPLSVDVREASEMVNLARSRGLMLFINFSNRWNPPFAIAREKIVSGKMGRPVYAYLRLSDTVYVPFKMLSWASKTNVVFFLMSHTVDLARWIFNDEVESVYATASRRILRSKGVDTYDYVLAILNFKRGSKALLESSWILPESLPTVVDFRAEILCEGGCVFIDDYRQGIEASAEKYTFPKYAGGYVINDRYTGFNRESIHHAVDSLLNEREPSIKPEDGLANTIILCSIIKSIESGEKVYIHQ